MKGKQIIKQEAIKSIFKGNAVYDDDSIPVILQLCLPPNGRIVKQSSENSRKIIFKSKLYSVEFDISAQSTMVLQNGIPGILPRDPQNENRYYASFYTIKVTGTSSMLGRYSEDSKEYKRWHENVLDVASELDWEKINQI